MASWEGPPQGTFLNIERATPTTTTTPCYLAMPSTSTTTARRHGIIVYTDVWGFQSRLPLICDRIAAQGYHVIVPDCFRGETKDDHPNDMIEWFQNTSWEAVVQQDTQACLKYLEEHYQITNVSALGFCWGGWALAKACQKGISWTCAISPHPSFRVEEAAFGGDSIQLMTQLGKHCPVLLLPGHNDPEYTKPQSPEFQRLQAQSRGGKSRSIPFPDMVHGWMTRSDLNDEKVRRDVDLGMKEIIAFLNETVQGEGI